jgi:outer membrane lipoprotein-sorting protein
VKKSFQADNVLLAFNFILYITHDLSNINSMVSPQHLVRTIIIVYPLAWSCAFAQVPLDSATILKKMEAAYSSVQDYQVQVEVRTFKDHGAFERDKFLYTFKKPNLTRLDFESPRSGMVMIYPDEYGKVGIKPSGFARFLRLHLAVDNPLLRVSSGQSIDKTDMGFLIKNISQSTTDQRRGPLEITEEHGLIKIRVQALNHFRKGVITLYTFTIDADFWLPVKVEESTPDGTLERIVTFDNLLTNRGISDSIFQLDDARMMN